MKQYSGEEIVYIPDFEGTLEACDIKTGAPKRGRLSAAPDGIIVLTQNELLDLMQEAIEYSHPILPRKKAFDFLKAKLKG
jgi:hypothetical protein